MTQRSDHASPVTIGLDIGDRNTHYCVLDAARAVVARGALAATPTALSKTLAAFSGGRVVLEAGSQSPWMSRRLGGEGIDVRVADPRRVQLISKDPRKTDRWDAKTLACLEMGMPELLGPKTAKPRRGDHSADGGSFAAGVRGRSVTSRETAAQSLICRRNDTAPGLR